MANPALPVTSPDISVLSYKVLFDISGALPSIVLTNLSTVTNPTNLLWWYVITTPAGIPIHSGSVTSPDVNHVAWSTLTLPTYAWTTPFGNPPCGQIEFSKDVPYICTLYTKDSSGNTFSLAIQQTITRPNGNTQASCGNFGAAVVNIEVKCNENPAMVYCNSNTNVAYNNKAIPDVQSSQWILSYPPDANGNQPDNGTAANTPTVKFPIQYSGDGYTIFFNNVCTYDMGNGASIKLQYKAINPKSGSAGISFAVLCNVNLCKLSCQIQTFYQLSKKSCGDLVNQNLDSKMTQMNLLLNQAIIGVFFPLCGIDVPALIKQIQAIGDLDENCDCGCGDTGVNFSYPLSANPSGNSGGGCCPVATNVIDAATNVAPANCPTSYFPVNVKDPSGTTNIGLAYDINGLIGILNSYPAWSAYGVAFAQGNCKVGWFSANSGTTIPDVKVEIIPDVNGGGGSGTGNGGGGTGTILQVDILLEGTVDAPPPCPQSYFPANVYNYGDTAVIGVANNITDLVNLLNADSVWSTFGLWNASGNCFAIVNLNNPDVRPTLARGAIYVELINANVDPVTVNKKIVTHGTSTPPPACPGSFYPAKVYDPSGTILLGIVNNITDMCSLLNSNISWSVFGAASPIDNCNVRWVLEDANNIPPDIQVDTNVATTTCINGKQLYSVVINDVCSGSGPITLSSFPINIYVDYGLGAGVEYAGNYSTQAAAVTGLNSMATKPSNITFSVGTTVDQFIVNHSTCSAAVIITADSASSGILLHGGNHSNLNGGTPTKNGYYGVTLKTNSVMGRLLPVVNTDFRFHTIKLNNGNTVQVESNTGKVYFYDNTLPKTPILVATVTLNGVAGNNFNGVPNSAYKVGATTAPSRYSLYMPTDYNAVGSLGNTVAVIESTTGSAWLVSASGVLHSFQDQRLLGSCPRIVYNDVLYLTLDGDMETYTGPSGVIAGYIVKLDLTNFNAGGISTKLILSGATEKIWAATYDGAGKIYFIGNNTSVAEYNPISDIAGTVHTRVVSPSNSYLKRVNAKYFNGKIYTTPVGITGFIMPVIDTTTWTVTDISNTPKYAHGSFATYNFFPLGNCLGVLTYNGQENNLAVARGGMCLVKLDGTYVGEIELGDVLDIYNVVSFGGQNVLTPTAFNS